MYHDLGFSLLYSQSIVKEVNPIKNDISNNKFKSI